MSETTETKPALVKNERTNWLRTLCASGLRACTNPEIAEPFSAILGGHRYIGATQGFGITLMLAQQDEDAPVFVPAEEQIGKLLECRWRPAVYRDFFSWLVARRWCGACGGVGFQSMPHLAAFGESGSGPYFDNWTRCDCTSSAVAAGVRLDKRRVLEHIGILGAPNQIVELAGSEDGMQLGIRGPRNTVNPAARDWIVTVMGLSNGDASDVFPMPEVLVG